jgi:hypothetical protein
MELHKKCELGVPGFAKGLKGSLRVSRFFEGAREKLRGTMLIGRCNFRVWREQVAVIFMRLRRGAAQDQWMEIWCGGAGILGGVFWGICSLRDAPEIGDQWDFASCLVSPARALAVWTGSEIHSLRHERFRGVILRTRHHSASINALAAVVSRRTLADE